jgi:hypothetical protein
MKTLEEKKTDVITDLFNTCISDGNFLWEVLASYVDTFPEDKVVQLHKEFAEV